MKELEAKVHIPVRYMIMAVCVLLLLVMYLLTRKIGFFTYFAFVISLVACTKSMHEQKGEEKKWASYWCGFALLQLLPSALEKNIYFVIVKFATLMYFTFFDDCSIVGEITEKAYQYAKELLDAYKEKYCKECETKKD